MLQADGYSGYTKVPGVTRCGCWAHVRRRYEEAMPKNGAKEGSTAAVGFDYCNRLFTIDAELEKLTADERKTQRQEHSRPVLNRRASA